MHAEALASSITKSLPYINLIIVLKLSIFLQDERQQALSIQYWGMKQRVNVFWKGLV